MQLVNIIGSFFKETLYEDFIGFTKYFYLNLGFETILLDRVFWCVRWIPFEMIPFIGRFFEKLERVRFVAQLIQELSKPLIKRFVANAIIFIGMEHLMELDQKKYVFSP